MTIDLLRQAETYLAVTHGQAARHDVLGEAFTCSGCALRERIAAALAEAATAPVPADADLRDQVLHALDFAYCNGIGYETPEQLLDAYDTHEAVLPAPADERYVRVPRWEYELMEQQRQRAERAEAEVKQSHADRPAVLREAADAIVAENDRQMWATKPGKHWAADLLRRMADEAQQAEPRPAEELTSGAQQCGHDDYHDAHEWADKPHIWCPGHSFEDEPAN